MLDKQGNNINKNIVPKEGRPTCLSSHNAGVGRPSLGVKKHFTEEQIENFIEFGRILKRIHVRLLMEGYKIEKDGTINPPKHKKQ